MFDHSSRGRLTVRDLGRFAGATLFDRIARVVCGAGCLPRKELFEAWETARRARRLFRGGRVIDLGAGHALLAHVMLLLDDSSPFAVAVDKVIPPCAGRLHEALVGEWPRLRGRVEFLTAAIEDTERVRIDRTDVVMSSHACGNLTDVVLDRAAAAGARVAVLPCCHHLATNASSLTGWIDGALAIDVMRAVRLQDRGYRVWTQTIPEAVTPRNRLLLASPLNTPNDFTARVRLST